MRIKDISIKWQLMFICILLVTVPVVSLGFLSYNSAKTATFSQIEQNLGQQALLSYDQVRVANEMAKDQLVSNLKSADMIILKGINTQRKIELDENKMMGVNAINQVTQSGISIKIPSFTINGENIFGTTHYVDKVKESTDLDCTIFQVIPQGLLRISTSITKQDGTRGTGTYIPMDSPVYQAIMKGETYVGRAIVLDKMYITAYSPIKDHNGKIIGALFVGQAERKFQEIVLHDMSDMVVGKTGYIFIVNSKGEYVLSLERKRDGENIFESKDANGNYFIQEIIGKAKALKEEQTGFQYYPWKNTGENAAKMKIASFSYFHEWDWIIAPSSYQEDFLDGLKKIQSTTVIVCIISIIIGAVIAYLFALFMTNTFNSLVSKMNIVAGGDLRVKLDEDVGKNELGQMSNSFGIMLGNLTKLVSDITSNANASAATAEELSASSEEVNASTEQVSSTIQEIAKGGQNLSKSANDTKQEADQLINSIKSVAQSAQGSAKNASEVNDAAFKGGDAAKKASQKMKSISEAVSTSAAVVQELGAKSQQINKVIEVINSISEQTNLLALNAAIEAARAGEAGRGFAVVADEVRKLAEESQKATKQIEQMIQEITASTKNAVDSMNKGSKEVEEGSQVVNEALGSLDTIAKKVSDLAAAVEEISASTEEQLASSERVQKTVSDVSATAEEAAASTEEVSASIEETTSSMQQVATSAQELAKGAENLKQLVSQFKIDDSQQATNTNVDISSKHQSALTPGNKVMPKIKPALRVK